MVAPRAIIPLQHRLQRAGGNGIDALERLVQKEDLGLWMTAAARASFFCMPWEKVGDQLLLFVGKVHISKQFLGALQRGRFV